MPVPVDVGQDASDGRAVGWHPDPFQRHQARFYDGQQWTEHVADGGFASLDTEPVAGRPWSRPHPERETPNDDGPGPRVLSDLGLAAHGLDDDLLLLDSRSGIDGQTVLGTDDRVLGTLVPPARAWPRRLLGALAVSAPLNLTRLDLRPPDGPAHLTLTRPARRTAPVVDVVGADGRLGTVAATRLRQGLEAVVAGADGAEVGRLVRVGPSHPAPVAVVAPSGATLARLTPVWDVPGSRQHLPPGMLLADRRLPPGSEDAAGHRTLLLGALLAPELLLPPPPTPT